jgi:hypothetical protein
VEVPVEFRRISDRVLAVAVAALAVFVLAAVGGYWLLAARSASAAHSSAQAPAITACQVATTSSAAQPNPIFGPVP